MDDPVLRRDYDPREYRDHKLYDESGVIVLSLDIGCGWDNHLHTNMTGEDVIGIDLNFKQGQSNVSHPIISDAGQLPIRDNVSHKLRCTALLEHLKIKSVKQCVRNIYRVMRKDGIGYIMFPVESNQPRNILRRAVREFPFGTFKSLQRLIKFRRFKKIPGMPHITNISPEIFKTLFYRIIRIRKSVHIYSKVLMQVTKCNPVYTNIKAGKCESYIKKRRRT